MAAVPPLTATSTRLGASSMASSTSACLTNAPSSPRPTTASWVPATTNQLSVTSSKERPVGSVGAPSNPGVSIASLQKPAAVHCSVAPPSSLRRMLPFWR